MTKTAKKQKCRDILKACVPGQPIKDLSNIDFLMSIFLEHEEWEIKRGQGLNYITSMLTSYGNKCFQLIRVDGSSTDISFISCIDKPSPMAKINKALRHAIKPDIIAYRDGAVVYGLTKCPFTNEVLTIDNTHIDHYDLLFRDLVNLWIKDYDVKYLLGCINKTSDNNIDTYFTDLNIVSSFRLFHNNNTNLRAVSKKANLSILR